MRMRGWESPWGGTQETKGGGWGQCLSFQAPPPASPLAPSSGHAGAEDWPLGHWAGTFLSADEVRQGWLPTDLSPQFWARDEPVGDKSVSSSRQPGPGGAGTPGRAKPAS